MVSGTIGLVFLFWLFSTPRRTPAGWPPWIIPYTILLTVVMLGVGLFIGWQRRHRRRIHELTKNNTASDLRQMVEQMVQATGQHALLACLPKLLPLWVAQGRAGQVLRFYLKPLAAPVPLTVAFEPRLIDEADSAFNELRMAATNTAVPSSGDTDPIVANRADRQIQSRLRRNMILVGGWITLPIFVLNVCISGWESYIRGSPSVSFWIWLFFLAWTALGLFSSPLSSGAHWLVAPSSLIFRNKKGLHLFERQRSLLCVYPFGRLGWFLVVADAERCFNYRLTGKEADFVLRAWLSPLPPPLAERLSDFG